MENLDELRIKIDEIDDKLAKLFEERMETVIKVAEYKKNTNIQILNRKREAEVIEKAQEKLKNKKYSEGIAQFFEKTMEISRGYQKEYLAQNISVCFQGVAGSFSEQALCEYFGEKQSRYSVKEFKDVFEEIKNGNADYGILPIENSSTGGISAVYDLLREYGFYIVGEKCLRVTQNLIGIKGSKIEDIKEVYSHIQGFEQSSVFFKEHPNFKFIPVNNTAAAAEYIKNENDNTKACVASLQAAKIYNLCVLKECINYNSDNYTRFIIISNRMDVYELSNKVSVVFALDNTVGTLFNALKYFSENDINMIKIESRPILNKSWQYFFYIDFDGNIRDEKVKEALKLIDNNSDYFKLLGNYKKDM